MIYTKSHNFLPALTRNGCSNLKITGSQEEVGGERVSTEDRLWNNLQYPTLSRLIIPNNIQVIFWNCCWRCMNYWKMFIKMQVFNLRSKTVRFSSECSLGIMWPNIPHLLAVALRNNAKGQRQILQVTIYVWHCQK